MWAAVVQTKQKIQYQLNPCAKGAGEAQMVLLSEARGQLQGLAMLLVRQSLCGPVEEADDLSSGQFYLLGMAEAAPRVWLLPLPAVKQLGPFALRF
jgi:hypothetical protein